MHSNELEVGLGFNRTFFVTGFGLGVLAQTVDTRLPILERSDYAEVGLALAQSGTTQSVVSPRFIFNEEMTTHPPAVSFKPVFEPISRGKGRV